MAEWSCVNGVGVYLLDANTGQESTESEGYFQIRFMPMVSSILEQTMGAFSPCRGI